MTNVLSFDIGMKNLAYCLLYMDKDNKFSNFLSWGVVDVSGANIDIISDNIIGFLDDILQDLNLEINTLEVLIENQPVLKAPTMKTIQLVIYTYFKLLCKYSGINAKPIFVSAGKKNSYMIKHGFPVKAKDYKSNKENSVKFTTTYLEKNGMEKELGTLGSYKKKDDICDAFLQVLAFYNCVIII